GDVSAGRDVRVAVEGRQAHRGGPEILQGPVHDGAQAERAAHGDPAAGSVQRRGDVVCELRAGGFRLRAGGSRRADRGRQGDDYPRGSRVHGAGGHAVPRPGGGEARGHAGRPGPDCAGRRAGRGRRRGKRRHSRGPGVPEAPRHRRGAACADGSAGAGDVVRLDFSGAPEIAAPPEVVWKRLLDHEFVASVAPGVESVQAIDDRHFKVVSGFGVGAVKVKFQLDVELSDVRPPKSLKMTAQGQAPGSGVDVSTTLEIEPLPADRSRLKWSASSEVRGTVASVGARLLKGTAQKLTESFWDKFAERVGQQPR